MDDGPLRAYEDPANAEFLNSIRRRYGVEYSFSIMRIRLLMDCSGRGRLIIVGENCAFVWQIITCKAGVHKCCYLFSKCIHSDHCFRSEVPLDLIRESRGGEVYINMADHRHEDYAPPKVTLKAFSGAGHTLGR